MHEHTGSLPLRQQVMPHPTRPLLQYGTASSAPQRCVCGMTGTAAFSRKWDHFLAWIGCNVTLPALYYTAVVNQNLIKNIYWEVSKDFFKWLKKKKSKRNLSFCFFVDFCPYTCVLFDSSNIRVGGPYCQYYHYSSNGQTSSWAGLLLVPSVFGAPRMFSAWTLHG